MLKKTIIVTALKGVNGRSHHVRIRSYVLSVNTALSLTQSLRAVHFPRFFLVAVATSTVLETHEGTTCVNRSLVDALPARLVLCVRYLLTIRHSRRTSLRQTPRDTFRQTRHLVF